MKFIFAISILVALVMTACSTPATEQPATPDQVTELTTPTDTATPDQVTEPTTPTDTAAPDQVTEPMASQPVPWTLEALKDASWADIQGWAAISMKEGFKDSEGIWLLSLVTNLQNSIDGNLKVNYVSEVPLGDIDSISEFLQKYQYIIGAFDLASSVQVKMSQSYSDSGFLEIPLSSS